MSRNKIKMYGQHAERQKDKDQLAKEEEEREQQRLQNKSQALNVSKNVRVFNHRLERYCAQSVLNKIEILDSTTLAVIDVIQTSHTGEIQCFDVAEISKDIVSYSTLTVQGLGEVSKHLVVCGLKDTSYLNGIDDKVTQELRAKCGRSDAGTTQAPQVLKWIEYWRCDPKDLTFRSFLNTVSLSPHGDALVLGGNEFLSVWTRDTSMSTHSYSVYLYYAKQLPKNMYAQCLEERDVLQVIQSEFSADGRTIITLEQSNTKKAQSLKVWYNVKMRSMEEPKIKKAFISRNPNREPEKGEVFRGKVSTTDLEFLDYFEIPISSRNGRLIQFRTLDWPQSLYADEQVIPIAFLVMTDKSQAQLWVENLNFSPSYDKHDPNDNYEVLSFSCVHVFGAARPRRQPGCHFDAQLLQQSSFLNSADFKEPEIDGRSGILDPSGEDYIQLAKTVVHERMFDNMVQPQLQGSISKDFIIVLDGNKVQIFSILGLRNFPTCALEIKLEQESPFNLPSSCDNTFFKFQNLLASCSDSLSTSNHLQDSLSLVCLNQDGSFLKLQKGSEENSVWKVESIKAKGTHKSADFIVEQVVAATNLPAVAILQNQNQILFYFEARSAKTVRNQQVLHDDFKFIGQYQSSDESQIKLIKWIPGLFQMLVLQDNGKLNLVSSKTFAAIIKSIASKGDFSNLSTIHHHKLQSDVQIEIFESIQDDLLAKDEPEGEIINFGVLGVRFLLCDVDDKIVKYQINIVVMTSLSLQFYQMIVSFGTGVDEGDDIKIQTTKLGTKPLGDGLKLHAVLSQFVDTDNTKAFQTPNPKLKCVVQVINSKCQFEVANLQVTINDFSIVWQKVLPSQIMSREVSEEPKPLDYDVSARISPKFATVLTRSVGRNWYYLYLYEHQMLNRYIGYLDLLDFIYFEPHDSAVLLKQGFALDYALTQAPESETILLTCLDRLHVICYNRQQEHWQCLRRVDLITGMDIRNIKSVQVIPTFQDNILLVFNHKELASINSCLQIYGNDIQNEHDQDEDAPKETKRNLQTQNIESIAHLGFSLQRSNPIYSISILKQLYINGKVDFIMKMLIQMNSVLKQELLDFEKNDQQVLKISSILNLTLQSLVGEVNEFVEAQVVQQDMVAAAEAEAANAATNKKPEKEDLGGFFGSDDDESSGMEDFDNPPPAPVAKVVQKKEEVKEVEKDRKIEQQFLEIFMDLLTSITKLEEQFGSKELVDFILVFKDIYAKDFFSDDVASTLLREVYLETQFTNKEILKELEIHSKKIEETEVVKRLQDHEIYAKMYNEKEDGFESQAYQNKGKGNLIGLEQWDSRKCALALFTVNQDVVLEELQTRFDLETNCSWKMVQRLCIPVWIKDDYKLRMMVEWIAKAAYRIAGDDQMKSSGVGTTPISKAEATSLWYLLMNKKSMLISLYEKEKGSGGDKVASLLAHDFSIERWKKAALKNAGVLRSKQRYLLCITFLLLANDVTAALQVIKQNLSDPIMGIIVCRMLLLQKPGDKVLTDSLHQIYDDFFITRGKQFDDVYLQSIGLWHQGKVVQAVNILQKDQTSKLDSESLESKYIFEQATGFQIIDPKSKEAKKLQKDKYIPLVTQQIGYELNKMVIKLKKAPKVTHALKDDEGSTGYGADVGDIFADFNGGGPSKVETKKDEPKVEKQKLEVDGSKLLNQSLYQCYLNQNILQAIFLLRESRDDIDPNDQSQMMYILLICSQIIKDQVQEIYDESNFSDETTSLCDQIDYLLNFALDIRKGQIQKEDQEKQNQLKIQKRFMQRLIEQEILRVFEIHQNCGAKETGGNSLLRYELELRFEAKQREQHLIAPGIQLPYDYCNVNKMMIRMEIETFKFMDYLIPLVEKPFLENTSKHLQYSNFLSLRTLIQDLEHHIECLIIFDHFEDEDILSSIKTSSEEKQNLDAQEIQFFNKKEEQEEAKEEPVKEVKKASQFDDMFGEDSSSGEDLMDMDLDAPKPPAGGQKGNSQGQEITKLVLSQEDIQSYKLIQVQQYCEISIQRLNSKIKQSIMMYLYLIMLAYRTQKFYIIKDLLSKDDLIASLNLDSKQIINFQTEYQSIKQQVLSILSLRQSDRNGQAQQIQNQIYVSIKELLANVKVVYDKIHFQNMKMHVQKFRRTIEKKISLIQHLQSQSKKEEEDIENEIAPEANADEVQDEMSLYQEQWDRDLFQAEKECSSLDVNLIPQQEGVSPLKQVEGDQNQILFGLLAKQGHINSQVYEFLRLWLNFIIINKTSEFLESSWVSKIDETNDLFTSSPCSSIDQNMKDKTQEQDVNENVLSSKRNQQIEEAQQIIFNPFYQSQTLINKFKRMSKTLEDECTLFFQEKLQVLQRKYLANIVGTQSSNQLYLHFMKYFFKNQEKMEAFWRALGITKNYGKPLSDQYLTLLGRNCSAQQEEFETKDQITYKSGGYDLRNLLESKTPAPKQKEEKVSKAPATYSATSLITQELLGTGIELFKQRGEQISDFAFDNTQNSDNIALGLMTSGIREIPVVNTLLFRNRIESGLQLIDEENLKWEECLHRYDPIAQIMYQPVTSNGNQPEIISAKDEPIITAIDSLYCHKTLQYRSKPLLRTGLDYVSQVIQPPKQWNGSNSDSYLAQTSKLDITHEDYTYPVESHPHLPLYMSGNRRGIICTWRFGRDQDKSLNQFMPEIDPRQADPKKACVKKIMFNQYGDKIMANNMEGSFSIYQIDCHSKHMRKTPIFSLYENMDSKVNDFDLVNSDNVICTISQKQKTVKIYDTLLPYCLGKNTEVMSVKLPHNVSGGNMIICNQRKQTVYTFNGRTGAMTELDLRMGLAQINQFQLSESHEITAACLNDRQDTLITGYKDGFIKIHAVDKYYEAASKEQKYLQLREKIDAFPFDFRSKKGTVQRIKLNKTGGLFASAQSGQLKLVRTSV